MPISAAPTDVQAVPPGRRVGLGDRLVHVRGGTRRPTRSSASSADGCDGDGTAWANCASSSHPVHRAEVDSPLVRVVDVEHPDPAGILPGGTRTWRIPPWARIAAGGDRHLHVVRADGRHVLETFGASWVSYDTLHVRRVHVVDLSGSGVGPQNGCRAYGGSAIGGLVTSAEAAAGLVEHPLALGVPGRALWFDRGRWAAQGSRWGYRRDGRMRQPGYLAPATEQDDDSPSTYAGPVPMGSYWVVPREVDLGVLGLSPAGLVLARAAQRHGAHVTDRSDAYALYLQDDGPGAPARTMADAILDTGGPYHARDVRILFRALRRVLRA